MKHLETFKLNQAPFVSERIELPAGIADNLMWEMAADMTYKMITRVMGLPFRAGKCQSVATVDANL